MKKTGILLVCLLTVFICAFLAGCGSKENTDVSNSKYVGTWQAVKVTAVQWKSIWLSPKFIWKSSKI